jgi:hypothetical protein
MAHHAVGFHILRLELGSPLSDRIKRQRRQTVGAPVRVDLVDQACAHRARRIFSSLLWHRRQEGQHEGCHDPDEGED